jgi:hypothetical protein
MVSGPSPDAKEAVELDLRQIHGLKWLKFLGLTIKGLLSHLNNFPKLFLKN